jgi:DNA-binding IclR family transcriptional regulator
MNNYLIPNLVKACEILKFLSNQPLGFSANEIENLANVPRTTAFRILKTLCFEGMVVKRGKLFFSGPELLQIGLNSLRSVEIRTLAIPFLCELATKTDLTAHLAVPSGLQSLILEVHDSPHPVRVASRPGTTVPLYCSSTGKIFLAYLYEKKLEEYFKSTNLVKHTDNTIVTVTEMQKEIECIERDGIAVDNNEFHEDVRCAAAAVRDRDGQVIAAVGVTGPAMHFSEDKTLELGQLVKQYADKLSNEMGYNP